MHKELKDSWDAHHTLPQHVGLTMSDQDVGGFIKELQVLVTC